MGNLGRPGYLATTDGMWPYTYNDCDAGITPNQSMTDGVSYLPGQRLPSCSCEGEDHPTPGKGRGCPEIDIIEVSADWGGMNAGVATQSFQVAPFDIWWYPNYEFMQTPSYEFSMVNTYTGGPFQQAVSTTSMLSNDWYDGKQFQSYWFEYVPGEGEDAYIAWVIGDIEMMRFDARAIGPNGNVGQRVIAEEPMSLIMNLGFSENWVAVDWENLYWPTDMYIDYVRWYQKEGEEMVTCDPPGYETTEYIRDHPAAYSNANYTHWEDAGYSWPKNTLMNGCSAGTENGNGNS
ncbi:beta-glucan synthesis-associated [Hortaea werneckii]|nr:beta-glucan synthesis-associated [Hortaea werneckii]